MRLTPAPQMPAPPVPPHPALTCAHPTCRGYQGDGKACAPNTQALKELQQLYWSEADMQASKGPRKGQRCLCVCLMMVIGCKLCCCAAGVGLGRKQRHWCPAKACPAACSVLCARANCSRPNHSYSPCAFTCAGLRHWLRCGLARHRPR